MRAFFRGAARPLVYGHRGASARAPENTLAAFARALDEGADGVELDVRDAACGTVVVVHDPTLDRTAKRPGEVARMAAAELAQIDVGGDTIPTLDQAIDLVRTRGGLVNVEVKGDVPNRVRLCRAVARTLARRSPRDRDGVMISSFRPEMLAALRGLGARVPMAFLFDEEHTGLVRARLLSRVFRPDGEHPQHRLADAATIRKWHARGEFVAAWTVDEPERVRALAAAGIDGLITNDPAGTLAILRPAVPVG